MFNFVLKITVVYSASTILSSQGVFLLFVPQCRRLFYPFLAPITFLKSKLTTMYTLYIKALSSVCGSTNWCVLRNQHKSQHRCCSYLHPGAGELWAWQPSFPLHLPWEDRSGIDCFAMLLVASIQFTLGNHLPVINGRIGPETDGSLSHQTSLGFLLHSRSMVLSELICNSPQNYFSTCLPIISWAIQLFPGLYQWSGTISSR